MELSALDSERSGASYESKFRVKRSFLLAKKRGEGAEPLQLYNG